MVGAEGKDIFICELDRGVQTHDGECGFVTWEADTFWSQVALTFPFRN